MSKRRPRTRLKKPQLKAAHTPVPFHAPGAGVIRPGTSRVWRWSTPEQCMLLVYDRDPRRPSEEELSRRAAVQREKSRQYEDFIEHIGTYEGWLRGGS